MRRLGIVSNLAVARGNQIAVAVKDTLYPDIDGPVVHNTVASGFQNGVGKRGAGAVVALNLHNPAPDAGQSVLNLMTHVAGNEQRVRGYLRHAGIAGGSGDVAGLVG